MKWTHIPAQPDKMLPEQWQCRIGDRSVAVLRNATRVIGPRALPLYDQWEAVLQGPDGSVGSMILTNALFASAQQEVVLSLHDMGWRT